MKLGMEDTIRISADKQACGSAVARYNQSLLLRDLKHIFGFQGDGEAEGSAESVEAVILQDLEQKIMDASALNATAGPTVAHHSRAPCGNPNGVPGCHSCASIQRNVLGQQICCDEVCGGCKGRQETAGQRLKREQELQLTELKERLEERDRQRLPSDSVQ